MKNKIAVLVTLAMVSAPVMAQNFDDQVFPNHDVKAMELSQTEMKEIQGEWVANAAGATLGAVGGHWGYMAGSIAGGTYNFGSHMAAIGGGAVIGALSPVNGARTFVHGMRGAAVAGAVGGMQGYAGSLTPNHTIRR